MEIEQDTVVRNRTTILVTAFLVLVVPFGVLFLSGTAELFMRAIYAVGLGGVMLWGGFWVAFRASPDDLVKTWVPRALKPAAAIGVRICGILVMVGAAMFVLPNTVRDVSELVSSGKAKIYMEAPRRIESKMGLSPLFQTVWLRGDDRYPQSYMFAFGGQRLDERRQYSIAVLPRSHWILSAHEEHQAARP